MHFREAPSLLLLSDRLSQCQALRFTSWFGFLLEIVRLPAVIKHIKEEL